MKTLFINLGMSIAFTALPVISFAAEPTFTVHCDIARGGVKHDYYKKLASPTVTIQREQEETTIFTDAERSRVYTTDISPVYFPDSDGKFKYAGLQVELAVSDTKTNLTLGVARTLLNPTGSTFLNIVQIESNQKSAAGAECWIRQN